MPRRRSTRALNNDAAIRAATIDLILNDGIDAISFRDVGRSAGLSHGALYARFEDVEELLVDLWDQVLCQRATTLFAAAVDAATNPSDESVRAVFDFVRNASPTDTVMVQVLLMSRRMAILHEEVESFIHDDLETLAVGMSSDDQARALLLFALVMVQILETSLFGLSAEDIEFLESTIVASLRVNPRDVAPVELREPTDRNIPLPKSDLKSQLAYHTISAVGKSGYTRATISRISRRANCSPGAIYKLFPSKEDLAITATRRLLEAPWITITALADILDEGVLTQHLFSVASEENGVRKNFTLEIAMASSHSAKIRAAVEAQLQGLEVLVPLLDGFSETEQNELRYLIRSIIVVTLGASFLSTITKVTDQIDFNQFAEPLRRSILERENLPWTEIRRQITQLDGPRRATTRP